MECIFDNTAKNDLPEAAKKISMYESGKKQDFFQNNKHILPQIVPLDTQNAIFQTTLKDSTTKCQKFFAL